MRNADVYGERSATATGQACGFEPVR